MTPENKKVVKIIAVSVGVAIILTVITVLIVKEVRRSREDKNTDSEKDDPAPKSSNTASSSGTSSMNTLNGRTFKKAEIEKMQSFLYNMGAMAINELIVSSIRDSGGIDGKIGTGFKTALNEAIRIKIVKDLDDLYARSLRF